MEEEDSRNPSHSSFAFRQSSSCNFEEFSTLTQSEEQRERQPSTLHFITHRHKAGDPLQSSIHHLRPQPLGRRRLASRRGGRELPTLSRSSHCPLSTPTGVQKNISEAVLMGTDPHVPGNGDDRAGVRDVQDCSSEVTTVPMGIQPPAIPRLFLFLYHSPSLPQIHSGDYSRNPEPYSLTSRGEGFQPAFVYPVRADAVSRVDPQSSQLFLRAQVNEAIPASDPCSETAFSAKLKVVLCNHALWFTFHRHQNEMILTKQGRLMFPFLAYQIQGMNPIAHYRVFVEMVLIDQHLWRYQKGKWIQHKMEKNIVPGNQLYIHPDSPNIGAHWMGQEISFRKLKLTNKKETSNNENQIIHLKSCHKYQPKLHIEEVRDGQHETLGPHPSHIFTFPETEFIAVTTYQNQEIIKLKIDHNQFASSFRKDCF